MIDDYIARDITRSTIYSYEDVKYALAALPDVETTRPWIVALSVLGVDNLLHATDVTVNLKALAAAGHL